MVEGECKKKDGLMQSALTPSQELYIWYKGCGVQGRSCALLVGLSGKCQKSCTCKEKWSTGRDIFMYKREILNLLPKFNFYF